MKWLLDTNVISELRRGSRADPKVLAWFAQLPASDVFLSALVVGEIRAGIERVRPRDPAFAMMLQAWLDQLHGQFSERIWPVDAQVADIWGRLTVVRTLPVVDGLLAATALAHDATLATRNVAHVAQTGARWFDPFAGS